MRNKGIIIGSIVVLALLVGFGASKTLAAPYSYGMMRGWNNSQEWNGNNDNWRNNQNYNNNNGYYGGMMRGNGWGGHGCW